MSISKVPPFRFALLPFNQTIGAKKQRTLSVQSCSRTLRVMDVRAENCGRLHQKVRFPAAPLMGRNFMTPGHPGRKGHECVRKIQTEKFMFVLFFFPEARKADREREISI